MINRIGLIISLIAVIQLTVCTEYTFAQVSEQDIKNNEKKEEKKQERKTTLILHIHVVGNTGKSEDSIEGANIDLKSEETGNDFSKNIVTNKKGVATYPNVPHGQLLVQIVAQGWETFGNHYKLDGSEKTIDITLKSSKKQ